MEFLSKIRIDMVLDDKDVEPAIDAILRAAKTGRNGDGKIFIYPVEDAVRISTGERGMDAI